MRTLYADDTYAKSSKSEDTSRIHLFGGIIVGKDCESLLINKIREIKGRYTHPNMPFKWNFKDTSIKKKYEEFNKTSDYRKMLADSRMWRLDLFRAINALDYSIIVACIEALPGDKEAVSKAKSQLHTYCFENVLMRVGLDAKNSGGNWQCVLDWPPDNDTRPFDTAYYRLFHFGQGASTTPAHCGPLEKLGFSHSLHFTKSNHSPLMQLADLVLGATRDHIECVVQGRNSCVGSEAVDVFYNHYRNLNGRVPIYGVVPSTRNTDLKKMIEKAFSRKTSLK